MTPSQNPLPTVSVVSDVTDLVSKLCESPPSAVALQTREIQRRVDNAASEFYHAVGKLQADIAEKHQVGRFLVIRDIRDVANEEGPGSVVCVEFKSP